MPARSSSPTPITVRLSFIHSPTVIQRSHGGALSLCLTVQSETPTLSFTMVLSLEDFDHIPLSNNTRETPPIHSPDSPGTHSDITRTTETTDEPPNQQSSSFATSALDPALLALSPPTPNRTTNPILRGEDLSQLARHLAFQKSLSKSSTDELVQFSKVVSSVGTPIPFFTR